MSEAPGAAVCQLLHPLSSDKVGAPRSMEVVSWGGVACLANAHLCNIYNSETTNITLNRENAENNFKRCYQILCFVCCIMYISFALWVRLVMFCIRFSVIIAVFQF